MTYINPINPPYFYFGRQNYEPVHTCSTQHSTPHDKPYNDALLDFHKQLKPTAQFYDCGNSKCIVEQIKSNGN